jgi:hypothetical protein
MRRPTPSSSIPSRPLQWHAWYDMHLFCLPFRGTVECDASIRLLYTCACNDYLGFFTDAADAKMLFSRACCALLVILGCRVLAGYSCSKSCLFKQLGDTVSRGQQMQKAL